MSGVRRHLPMSRRGPRRALMAIVAGTGAGLVCAVPAAGATGEPPVPTPSGLSVGLPRAGGADQDGRVDAFADPRIRRVLYGDAVSATAAAPPGSADQGFGTTGFGASGFGASVAQADLDGDGDLDLVVGAPGNPGSRLPGEVYVVFRTPRGFDRRDAVVLAPSNAAADRVGAAVAVSVRDSRPGVTDLWVGAPGTDVDGAVDAGTVYHYTVTREPGGGRPAIRPAHTLTQDTTEVGGAVEQGDRFGSVLSPGVNGVAVGVPDEDLGADAPDAGAMQLVRISGGTGALLTGQVFTQATSGTPGAAEAGDRFGAAVAGGGRVVGAPGEDVGPHQDAGQVQTYAPFPDLPHALVPAGTVNQDSPGVRGTVEAGDRFGSALAVGSFDCAGVTTVAVGVPDEDIRRRADAGTVNTFALARFAGPDDDTEAPSCAARGLHQNHGLPGVPEPGDRTGAALGALPASRPGGPDTLAIGVPGEDVGVATDTGRVVTWRRGAMRAVVGTVRDVSGSGYGTVIGSTAPVIP